MTTKQMESLNRRNRVRLALLDHQPIKEIARREGITLKYVYILAEGFNIHITRGGNTGIPAWGLQ